ncbi:MAG: hypothetical protein Q9201_006437 [Fulgogasparrea decipioides]
MHLVSFLIVSTATIAVLPGILAIPAQDVLPKLQERWFTINPDANPEADPRVWPNHKLKYKFKNDYSKAKLRQVVKDGWQLWTDNGVDKTKIDIIESMDDDALVIEATNKQSARTTIGKAAGATMTFGTGRDYGFLDVKANMAHELGHALGFYHEHQRYDRDDHVKFNCKNLKDWTEKLEKDGFCDDIILAQKEGWSSQDFITIDKSEQDPPLYCYSDYDEDSIMHYPGGAGAKSPMPGGRRKTVLANKSDGKSFKKNLKPSSKDVARANALYTDRDEDRCPVPTTTSVTPTNTARPTKSSTADSQEPTSTPDNPDEEECREALGQSYYYCSCD